MALKWAGETLGICCNQGKISLAPLEQPPMMLLELLTANSTQGKHFRNHIRAYNTALAFTSVGVKVDERFTQGGGAYSFRIQGGIYHRIGSLLPENVEQARFSQIYVFDGNETERRQNVMSGLQTELLAKLQQLMHDINPFVRQFRSAVEQLAGRNDFSLKMVIREEVGNDRRTYNVPTNAELAVLMPVDGSEEVTS